MTSQHRLGFIKQADGNLIISSVQISKPLNGFVMFACLVIMISCSSVQTKVIPAEHTDENIDLAPRWTGSSSTIDSTISSPPISTIKLKANQFPNVDNTPLLARPIPTISSTETSDSSYKIGYEHYRKGEYDLAINELTDAIQLNPSLSVAYWVRGLSYSRKDLYEQAITDYDMAIKLDPQEPKLYRNRGMVYHKLNLERQALHDFSEAIQMDSNFGAAYRNRAHNYVIVGRYRDALVDLDSAIHLDPNRAALYKDRAEVYEKIGLTKRSHSDNSKACSLEVIYC